METLFKQFLNAYIGENVPYGVDYMQTNIKRITSLIIQLIKNVINTEEGARLPSSLSLEEGNKLFALAKSHDMGHLVGYALVMLGIEISAETQNAFQKEQVQAVYRYEQQNYELEKVCEGLEKTQIPFLPLKGSVIRAYYPEPWMRTSCDIDILVKKEDAEKVADYLVNQYEYSREEKGSHDISLFSLGKVHVELHYDLIEEGGANDASEVLKTVWETAILREGKRCWYDMPDEMFYFYHIAHMAKHFENGGCGIRPFIDLWILDNLDGVELKKRNELLQQGNLLKFAEVAGQLSKVWFEGAEHTEITKQMEQYILRGGVYGTMENRVAVQQQKKGGRLKYALSKIFLPYDVIKFHYPVLQKHRWLMPFMQVRRWFKLIFCGHAKRSIRELKQNKNISLEEAERVQTFLENIGL